MVIFLGNARAPCGKGRFHVATDRNGILASGFNRPATPLVGPTISGKEGDKSPQKLQISSAICRESKKKKKEEKKGSI